MTGDINVLLSPGGIVLAPAMLASFKNSTRYKTHVIAADCDQASGNLFSPLIDERFVIPPITDENYIVSMVRLIRDQRIDFWLSLLDAEQPLLARHIAEIENTGCKLLRKPLPQFCEALDKSFVYKKLMGTINMPRMFFLDDKFKTDDVWNEFKGKLIIKVCNSSGARNLFLPEDYEEYVFYIKKARKYSDRTGSTFVVQEFIQGIEHNTSMLHDKNGKYIYAINRKKFDKRIIRNTTVAAAIERNDKIIHQSLDAVSRLCLYPGLNNVETIVSDIDKKPYFIEINAGRTAAQDMNLVAAGVNITDFLIDMALDKPCPQLEHPVNGTAILRVTSEVVVNMRDIENIDKSYAI